MATAGAWQDTKDAAGEAWRVVRTHNWRRTTRTAFQRKYLGWWFLALLCAAALLTLSLSRDTIIALVVPYSSQLASQTWAWLLPLAGLIVVGIPPLGGHTVLLILTGVVWGWREGMLIAAGGMVAGQLLCFFAFRRFLASRALSYEAKNVFYACVARLMRDGSLWIVALVRYSTIPTNVISALQATAGMPFGVYFAAIILALPKSLAFVYVGAIYADAGDPDKVATQLGISLGVMGATGLATVASFWVLWMRARRLYPELEAEQAAQGPADEKRRKRRPRSTYTSLSSSLSSSPDSSSSELTSLPAPCETVRRKSSRGTQGLPPLPPIPPFLREQLERSLGGR